MTNSVISSNTQAVLLLTAPLIVGRGRDYSSELLTHSEYNRLARILRDNQSEPSDLLGPNANDLMAKVYGIFESERLVRLLGRGFLLSQAVERWQARAVWVISRGDDDYPHRLKERLKEAAPSVLYGCGDPALLETGGLAVVGSRNVDDTLMEYAGNVGRLAARAHCTVISGAARGIDQAAMRGALEAGGCAVGVLTDSLERLAVVREHREPLMEKQLVLISPYDPAAGFDVGHAMQRNKTVYALSDAALVVNTDYESGGTWAGAAEQLEKLHLVPVYVRFDGDVGQGLKALERKGALPWPNPSSQEEFAEVLTVGADCAKNGAVQAEFPFFVSDKTAGSYEADPPQEPASPTPMKPGDKRVAKKKKLIS